MTKVRTECLERNTEINIFYVISYPDHVASGFFSSGYTTRE